ncbi:MAG TPA: hypothetical protein VMT71_04695 [Syntrophorhabdales bacterium]|nr:hypothetical protein [Syntrophorhabdales bacterium]
MKSKGFSLMETVVFIVLAALIIPLFYLTTQPVIKDMMTPTAYIKARFAAERKMEELMAYRFNDTPTMDVGSHGPSNLTTDSAFPAAEYAGYQWKWVVNYLDCNDPVNHCVGYLGTSLVTTSNPTNYKQIDLTVTAPQGLTYTVTSAITARY